MIVLALIDVADEDDVLVAYGYQSECHLYSYGVVAFVVHAYGLELADLELELMHHIPIQG